MSSLLADLSHYFGGDLSSSNIGDLATATGTLRGQQRVLRRLLTNPATATTPGDYISEPTYGAGLPSFIGKTLDIAKLRALIIAQMLLEDSVAATPTPVVTITTNNDVTEISVQINYNDQPSNKPVVLSFTISP